MAVQLPSILISDDDQALRETIRGIFEPAGFRTYLAGDGEEAIKIVHSECVHVVLVDMHMPKLTGLDVVRWLRRYNRVLPCILMSANLDSDIEREAKALQTFRIVAKPFSGSDLRKTVVHALRRFHNWPATDQTMTDQPATGEAATDDPSGQSH